MKLRLHALPPTTRGIYTTRAGPNTLPERFRYLHPQAAVGFAQLEAGTGGLIYTDILRSAEESLHAAQTKTGVQPPGYSGHNFGFSFDCDIEGTMRAHGWDYARLLRELEGYGWYCHRRDGAAGWKRSEMWHYNYFGADAPKYLALERTKGWGAPLEQLVVDIYGKDFELDDVGVQINLKKLGMYAGDIDGLIGPLSLQAVWAFQRAWLVPGRILDARTKRVLAFVAAEREVV